MGTLQSHLKKPEKEWDDGTDNVQEDPTEEKTFWCNLVLIIYGFLAGFLGMQGLEYLNQYYLCTSAGREFTTDYMGEYTGPSSIILDVMMFLIIYALLAAVAILLDWLMRWIVGKKTKNIREIGDVSLMWGLLVMTAVSVITLFLPFNLFYVFIT